jgi:hypothetical protein
MLNSSRLGTGISAHALNTEIVTLNSSWLGTGISAHALSTEIVTPLG